MGNRAKTLQEMVKELPPERQDEVREFVQRLLTRERGEKNGTPKLAWAGALKDLRDRFTSVELQHQIARWRIEGE
jgi:hypothetical protein